MQPRDLLALEKEGGTFEKQKQHYFVHRCFKSNREHHALQDIFCTMFGFRSQLSNLCSTKYLLKSFLMCSFVCLGFKKCLLKP